MCGEGVHVSVCPKTFGHKNGLCDYHIKSFLFLNITSFLSVMLLASLAQRVLLYYAPCQARSTCIKRSKNLASAHASLLKEETYYVSVRPGRAVSLSRDVNVDEALVCWPNEVTGCRLVGARRRWIVAQFHIHIFLFFLSHSFPLLPTCSQQVSRVFLWFHLITHRHTPQSVGLLWMRDRTVAETCTWQHKHCARQISMPPVGFEPTIPASSRPQT
jgi:hypothetical protein